MKLRKIGAILMGVGMLGATLAPLAVAKDVPPTGFFVNKDGTTAAMIIVGDGAAASDVVSASLIAAKIGSIAVKTETVTLPGVQHSVTHTDIGPGDTVADVPDATPYGGISSGNYTLDSLWWFDDNGGVLYGDSDGRFDPWETHEEIQIRFDDLWLFNQLSGFNTQDHKADLIGGDFNFWNIDPAIWIVPGLIYRVDNIRAPPVKHVESDYLVWQKTPLHEREWRSDNRPPAQPEIPQVQRVDLDMHYSETLFVPDPYFWYYGGQPKFKFFGKIYDVVDAKLVMNYNTRTGEIKNPFGTPIWSPFLVTGKAQYYIEQYLYRDKPEEYGGYEITLKDVDVDHNKAYFKVTDSAGDSLEFWMVLDPEHGFSPKLQEQGQTGQPAPEIAVGWSKDDLFFDRTWVTFKDDFGDVWLIGDYVAFAMDGIATLVGAGGTGGVLMNIYSVEDSQEWYTTQCCIPYVEEPNSYSLYLDRYPSLGYLSQASESTSRDTNFYPDQEDSSTWPPMPPGNDLIYDPQNIPSLYDFSYGSDWNLWETVETYLIRQFRPTGFEATAHVPFPIDFNSNIDNYNNVSARIGWQGNAGPPMITSNPDFWLDESPPDWSPDIIASNIYRAWRTPPNDLDRKHYKFLGTVTYNDLKGGAGTKPIPYWGPDVVSQLYDAPVTVSDAPLLETMTWDGTTEHKFNVYGIPWWLAGEGWIDLDGDGYLTFIDFDMDGLADVWDTPISGDSFVFTQFRTEINPDGSEVTYYKNCSDCPNNAVYTKDGFPASRLRIDPNSNMTGFTSHELPSPWTNKPTANDYHWIGDTFGGWDPGPDHAWGIANVDDDGNGFEDDNGEQGWPGSDDLRVGCSAGIDITDDSTVGDSGIMTPPFDCLDDDFEVPGDDFHWTGFDWMYEFNIGLCETFEMIKCVQAYVFVGPDEYFKLDMSDINWDDNNDGWAMYGPDGRPGDAYIDDDNNGVIDDPSEFPDGDDRPEDNGLTWRTIMETSQGTYEQLVKVNIDPTQLVKLDIEITDADKQNYNMILIGGPVANRMTKEIVDLGIVPNDGSAADWMFTSSGDYKLYSNPYGTGKEVLIVAGANREETRLAAEDLIAHM